MGALSLRLPESIHRHIRDIAKAEGVSINQLISSAIAEKISAIMEKISAIMTEEYLQKRADRANTKDMEAVLNKVADRKPLKGDEL
jgi:predicted DNA-binding ribbon-helix-helix protein